MTKNTWNFIWSNQFNPTLKHSKQTSTADQSGVQIRSPLTSLLVFGTVRSSRSAHLRERVAAWGCGSSETHLDLRLSAKDRVKFVHGGHKKTNQTLKTNKNIQNNWEVQECRLKKWPQDLTKSAKSENYYTVRENQFNEKTQCWCSREPPSSSETVRLRPDL